MTIFGSAGGLTEEIVLPDAHEIDKNKQLEWEKELLGLYLTDHPLSDYLPYMKGRITHYTGQIMEAEDKSEVIVAGTIAEIRTIITKKGDEMAFARLEDIQGDIALTLFPRTWKDFGYLLQEEGVLFIKGKLDTRRNEPQVLVDYIEKIDLEKLRSVDNTSIAFSHNDHGFTYCRDDKICFQRLPGDENLFY